MPQDTYRDRAGQGVSGAGWDGEPGSSQSSLERAREEAARQGSSALNSLKEGARSLGEEAQERVSGYAETGKQAVTENLEAFAQAVRKASDELSERDQTMAAQFVRQGATTLERITRSIQGTSLEDMIRQVRTFARDNPTAFIGGAMLAGFAVARFARASSQPERPDWQRRDDSRSSDDRGYGGGSEWAGSRSGRSQWQGSGTGGNEGISPSPYSGSSYPSGQRSSFASNTGGSGDVPPATQGYAGGGMSTDPARSSGPSSETDESYTTASSSRGSINSGAISTGENS